MYLVDTNIWLERLLDQDKSESVRKFLDIVPSERLFISDFSFHSIGVTAEKNDLTLVSFDADFDRTERGKKSPGVIYTEFKREEADKENKEGKEEPGAG
jgi:predicted nucleic acid-binding protein